MSEVEVNAPLSIRGEGLQVDDVMSVVRGRKVSLSPDALPGILRSRRAVERLVSEGRVAYGITTGFGHFKDKHIAADQVAALQVNLVRSHAAGVGDCHWIPQHLGAWIPEIDAGLYIPGIL